MRHVGEKRRRLGRRGRVTWLLQLTRFVRQFRRGGPRPLRLTRAFGHAANRRQRRPAPADAVEEIGWIQDEVLADALRSSQKWISSTGVPLNRAPPRAWKPPGEHREGAGERSGSREVHDRVRARERMIAEAEAVAAKAQVEERPVLSPVLATTAAKQGIGCLNVVPKPQANLL